MLSTRIQIVFIDVGRKHRKRAISILRSEAIEILAQFLAVNIAM